MAISGVVGGIYKADGASTAFSQKPLTNSGDNKRYFITDRTQCYWDDKTAVTVEKSIDAGVNWTVVTTGFVLEHAGGHVVFAIDQGTVIFRASGNFFTPTAVGGGYNWSADVEVDMLDSTTFASNGWKEFTPGYAGFSGSFESFWANGDNLADVGNESLILVLYVEAGANKTRYEGYARISTNSIETPMDDLVKDNADFQGSGKLYYRAG